MGVLHLVGDGVNPYAQLSVGPAFALTTFQNPVTGTSEESVVGWVLPPAIGCYFLLHRRVGIYVQLDWYFAPILENLMAERHQSGGFAGSTGVRVNL